MARVPILAGALLAVSAIAACGSTVEYVPRAKNAGSLNALFDVLLQRGPGANVTVRYERADTAFVFVLAQYQGDRALTLGDHEIVVRNHALFTCSDLSDAPACTRRDPETSADAAIGDMVSQYFGSYGGVLDGRSPSDIPKGTKRTVSATRVKEWVVLCAHWGVAGLPIGAEVCLDRHSGVLVRASNLPSRDQQIDATTIDPSTPADVKLPAVPS